MKLSCGCQKQEIKIIPSEGVGFGGCYIPLKGVILYDKRLDNFPTLKEEVIAHEMKHVKHGFNYLAHMWIDIIDYPKFIFNENNLKIIASLKKSKRLENKEHVRVPLWVGVLLLAGKSTYELVIYVYKHLLIIPIVIYCLYIWRRNKKKRKLKRS